MYLASDGVRLQLGPTAPVVNPPCDASWVKGCAAGADRWPNVHVGVAAVFNCSSPPGSLLVCAFERKASGEGIFASARSASPTHTCANDLWAARSRNFAALLPPIPPLPHKPHKPASE
jgi:hypothetical protein